VEPGSVESTAVESDDDCYDVCWKPVYGYILGTNLRCLLRLAFASLHECVLFSGVVVIALFVYGCTATAFMYGKSTTLAIWLSVFLPCGLCCFLFGVGMADSEEWNCCNLSTVVCALSWWLGLLIGLLAAYLWLTPWWMMTHNGTMYSVDAGASAWIQNNTTPDYGPHISVAVSFDLIGRLPVSVF
jgi:hypothetical protein